MCVFFYLTLFSIGFFKAADGWGWGGGRAKRPPSLKSVTHPTMMKLGTVIPHSKTIQKMYELRDTPFEFCLNQHFFTGNQQIFLSQEIQVEIVF